MATTSLQHLLLLLNRYFLLYYATPIKFGVLQIFDRKKIASISKKTKMKKTSVSHWSSHEKPFHCRSTDGKLGNNEKALWPHGVVVISTVQLYLSKPELRSCGGSNPICSMSEICNSEDLWQWSWLKIGQNTFHRLNIP